MRNSLLLLTPLLAALPCFGCVGLEAGSHYPDYSSAKVEKLLLTPENHQNPSISLGAFKISDEACEGIDTHAITARLAQDDLARFVEQQGGGAKQAKARGKLYWFDFPGRNPQQGEVVRLRLAVLDTPEQAAADLHKSLLEHGPGWWGLRRSNLSVLAPRTSIGEAMAFALRHKLVCWGMFMMANADDVVVVPGPYMDM